MNLELLQAGIDIEQELIAFRRDLHSNPELSFQESRTAEKVSEALSKLNLEVKYNVGGYGIVADLKGIHPGRTVALRADMDALPIQEETGLSFASNREGIMHACGHDAHTTILIGAARILASNRELISGNVRFIFQSAEEINAGAKKMVSEGVLEGVDEIYGLHNLPTLSVGKVAVRSGPLMGSVDRIEILIEGTGGHGAIPESSVDPIVAASAIVMGLQTAVSREISPFDPVVVTIGSIHAGNSYNVITHRVELTGTIRTFSPHVQKLMPERLQRIVGHIAAAYRCTATLNYIELVPVLLNNDKCLEHVKRATEELIQEANLVESLPTLAGEDFSIYLRDIPGCYFWLGSGPTENANDAFGLHHPKYNINEGCLSLGASLFAKIALLRTAEGEPIYKRSERNV